LIKKSTIYADKLNHSSSLLAATTFYTRGLNFYGVDSPERWHKYAKQ